MLFSLSVLFLLVWLPLRVFALQTYKASTHLAPFTPELNIKNNLRRWNDKRDIISINGIEDGRNRDDEYSNMGNERKSLQVTTLYEINRMFRLSAGTIDNIVRSHAVGYTGVILSLDSCLVDLSSVLGYSFAILAGDLDQTVPDPQAVKDVVGCTFKDCTIALGWNIPPELMSKYESRFFTIVDMLLDKFPIEPRMGAEQLIERLLDDGNDVTVCTCLPRDLALKVMGKSQLARLFEGRVPPDHLLYHLPANLISGNGINAAENSAANNDDDDDDDDVDDSVNNNYGDRYMNRRFVQCCQVMRKPPSLCVVIDGNRRHVLAAKRNGVTSIALAGLNKGKTHYKCI